MRVGLVGTRTDDQPFEMRGVALFRITGDVIVAGSLYMEAVEAEPVDIAQAVEGLSGHRPARAPDDESSKPDERMPRARHPLVRCVSGVLGVQPWWPLKRGFRRLIT